MTLNHEPFNSNIFSPEFIVKCCFFIYNDQLKEVIIIFAVLPCFYLYNEEEQSFNERNDLHKQCSSLSIEDSLNIPADSCVEERWDDESYEYDRALGADRIYLKFKKRLEAYPEQCIR